MRRDMAKVVVERPRYNDVYSYQNFRRDRKRVVDEEGEHGLPRHEGIRRPYGRETKRLNENLSPLRRFLRSQVGRPWNKVYAEISENLRASNPVQQHVRDHLKDYVFLNVYTQHDGYYSLMGRWPRKLYKGDLYVNEAGILCQLKHSKPKNDARYRTYVISFLTESTEGRRHVRHTKTTYFLALKKKYAPVTGEKVEREIQAVSYESARAYFEETFPVNPVTTEISVQGCRCLNCARLRSERYQREAEARERQNAKLSAAG